MTNTNLRTQIATLAKSFQPDPRLDEPVMAARDEAREARAELERAKANLDQVARAHRPGTDTTKLDAATREVERAQANVRNKLEATVKATAEREAKCQRAALAAFDKARPVISELVDALSELDAALRPLQEFTGQRDIGSTRELANFPAFRMGVDALRGMARQ